MCFPGLSCEKGDHISQFTNDGSVNIGKCLRMTPDTEKAVSKINFSKYPRQLILDETEKNTFVH